MSFIRIILIFPIVLPITAKAEFLLQNSNSDPGTQISQTEPTATAKMSEERQPLSLATAHAAEGKKGGLHRSTAHGFGNQIPLNFAVRQIVPSGYAVNFGHGINRDARVNWHGGQTWSAALRQAVKPLQLKVRLEEKIVHISKM